MKKQKGLFWICLAGTILLALGVIYLPRYISRSLDLRSMGQVEVAGRDNFSFLEAGSNDLPEVARAFQYLEKDGENPALVTSIDDPEQISRELLEHVYMEANEAAGVGMLPWLEIESEYEKVNDVVVPVYINWLEYAKCARYYSLTCESKENPNKKELLNFWYVRFCDDERFDYSFIVNAITYQIYYAEIYNIYTERMADEIETIRKFTGKEIYDAQVIYDDALSDYGGISELGSMFSGGCQYYYDNPECEYISQTGQKALNEKIGIVILYCMENDGSGAMKNVYIVIQDMKEPRMGGFRGISVGFQGLSDWARNLPE